MTEHTTKDVIAEAALLKEIRDELEATMAKMRKLSDERDGVTRELQQLAHAARRLRAHATSIEGHVEELIFAESIVPASDPLDRFDLLFGGGLTDFELSNARPNPAYG